MKTTERYLGLILEHSQVTAVEIAHSPKGLTLTAAGSFQSVLRFDDQDQFGQPGAAQRERMFVSELTTFFRRIASGSKLFSFGLNSRMVMLQTVPIDTALTGTDVDTHTNWEVGQFFGDVPAESFIISSQVLETQEDVGIATTVIVAVRKAFVNFLTRVSTQLGGALNIVDVDHFAAEYALTANYPDAGRRRLLLVGVDEQSFDVSLLVNGATRAIQSVAWEQEHDMSRLGSIVTDLRPEAVYFHGRILTDAMLAAANEQLGIPVEVLDPFKVVALPHSLKNYEQVAQLKHSYASAVGLALRTE